MGYSEFGFYLPSIENFPANKNIVKQGQKKDPDLSMKAKASPMLHAFSQKCLIPSCLMKNMLFKAGNLITVSCGIHSYICRLFPLPATEPEICISIDDTVSFESTNNRNILNSKSKTLVIPDDLNVIKTIVFKKLQVSLILEDDAQTIGNCQLYEEIAFMLLQNFVVKKNATVKCSGQELANQFHIHSILILESFHDEHTFGYISRTSFVEVVEMRTKNQLMLLKDFENTEIAGMSNTIEHLKTLLIQEKPKRVIVLGPSGCGKSSVIKKFCIDLKFHMLMIDGMKEKDFNIDKCNMYHKQLTQSSTFFPSRPSILFIDHIDELASSNVKNKKNVVILLELLKNLKHTDVLMVSTALQKDLLHPAISCFFEEEIFLGIPTINQRKEILRALTKSYLCEIDYERIAGLIPGFLPCDIVRLIQETINVKTWAIHAKEDSKDICLTSRDFEIALPSISPSVLKTSEWNLRVKPVYWKDIGGVHKIKERLQMSIELPLSHPEIFEKVDLHCPRGVLLFGPPGCCKTTLARGLATECNANFFAANPSQIYSSYVGESEKNITQLFYQARISAPSIIFLDELDSLVGYRNLNSKQQGVAEKVLSTLLNEMDGLGIKIQSGANLSSEFIKRSSQVEANDEHQKHSNDDVIVVAATNRPDCIDDALLRPGRFDIILYVPPPNSEERESILQTITDGMPLQDIDLKKIVEKTNNFTGADLKNLCNMAAMISLKEDILKATYITEKHFMQALEKLKPSVSTEQIQMYERLATKYGPIISE
ncbi:spermatogenesis-associated protein 5-like protein 1 [Trichonephila clavata]|uniref:Spermatogenesis-associated protein 5-like protein 1 n=1 Tax=Trichonephila clavata TaxID=2740835 RepID=A0A8X6JY82_TRICU|nr:spermatogenesis-associated protein 5-like protein 1 [Trichonephila clavata]